MTAALTTGLVVACTPGTSTVNVEGAEAPKELPRPDAAAPMTADARTTTVDDDEEERRRQLQQELEEQRQQQRYRHRTCSPTGGCPPYGGPFADGIIV